MGKPMNKNNNGQAKLKDLVVVTLLSDVDQAKEYQTLLKLNDIPATIQEQFDPTGEHKGAAIMVPEDFLDEAHVVIESQDAYDDFYDYALEEEDEVDFDADMLDEVDMVLLMTVEPGFGGQKFLDLVLPKIRRTRELLGDRPIWLQVDGGVSAETIERCAEAGADTFVAGSAVYNSDDPDAMVNQLRDLAVTACRH